MLERLRWVPLRDDAMVDDGLSPLASILMKMWRGDDVDPSSLYIVAWLKSIQKSNRSVMFTDKTIQNLRYQTYLQRQVCNSLLGYDTAVSDEVVKAFINTAVSLQMITSLLSKINGDEDRRTYKEKVFISELISVISGLSDILKKHYKYSGEKCAVLCCSGFYLTFDDFLRLNKVSSSIQDDILPYINKTQNITATYQAGRAEIAIKVLSKFRYACGGTPRRNRAKFMNTPDYYHEAVSNFTVEEKNAVSNVITELLRVVSMRRDSTMRDGWFKVWDDIVSNFHLFTPEKLLELSLLVEEYNVEWVLGMFDWGADPTVE